jgi:hypothetical protein
LSTTDIIRRVLELRPRAVPGNFVVVWRRGSFPHVKDCFGQRYSQIVRVELMHFRVE